MEMSCLMVSMYALNAESVSGRCPRTFLTEQVSLVRVRAIVIVVKILS